MRIIYSLLFPLIITSSLFAGGRIAFDAATGNKHDAWAEDVIIEHSERQPHFFDIYPTDHRQHISYSFADKKIKINKDSLLHYTYTSESGWYLGIGLSSVIVNLVGPNDRQPSQLLSFQKPEPDRLFRDNITVGYFHTTDAARGKVELCFCSGVMIRTAVQWVIAQKGSWECACHLRGAISNTIDMEAMLEQEIASRVSRQPASSETEVHKLPHQEEITLGVGIHMRRGGLSIGAEYQFNNVEAFRPGVRTPISLVQSVPRVTVSTPQHDLKKNDAAGISMNNDLVLELPDPSKEERSVSPQQPYRSMYYVPALPDAREQHSALFDVTYSWEHFRICAHYRARGDTEVDSLGVRLSYHF